MYQVRRGSLRIDDDSSACWLGVCPVGGPRRPSRIGAGHAYCPGLLRRRGRAHVGWARCLLVRREAKRQPDRRHLRPADQVRGRGLRRGSQWPFGRTGCSHVTRGAPCQTSQQMVRLPSDLGLAGQHARVTVSRPDGEIRWMPGVVVHHEVGGSCAGRRAAGVSGGHQAIGAVVDQHPGHPAADYLRRLRTPGDGWLAEHFAGPAAARSWPMPVARGRVRYRAAP
jgi:hypothetical protein